MFCKYFDHTDGKAWKILVFNAVTQSPALVYDLRLAPFRSEIDNTDPNERMFPTQHPFNPSRFTGTLLSALDLVWFTEKDSSKINYNDWAGSIGKLETPECGIHEYICDIVAGYYVKLDSSDTKKYRAASK